MESFQTIAICMLKTPTTNLCVNPAAINKFIVELIYEIDEDNEKVELFPVEPLENKLNKMSDVQFSYYISTIFMSNVKLTFADFIVIACHYPKYKYIFRLPVYDNLDAIRNIVFSNQTYQFLRYSNYHYGNNLMTFHILECLCRQIHKMSQSYTYKIRIFKL